MVVMPTSPTKDRWTSEEEDILRRCSLLGMDAPDTARALAEAGYKRGYKMITRKRARMGLSRKPIPASNAEQKAPLSIIADRVLVLSDIHAPYHDQQFMTDVIDLALRLGCTHCLSLGDLIDFASLWWQGREPGVELGDEIIAARRIMDALESCFAVYAIAGNHDERMARMLQHRAGMELLAELWTSPRIRHSAYRWMRFESGGETWQAEHPISGGINATIVPKRLAPIHLIPTIAGHGPERGMTRDVSGRF